MVCNPVSALWVRLFILIIAMLSGEYAQAQTALRIKGQVVDEEGIPLPFAHLSIIGSPLGGVTNASGIFRYDISEAHSRDTIRITHIGYEALELPVVLFVGNDLVEVQLRPQVVELEQVQVASPFLLMKRAWNHRKTDLMRPYLRRTGILSSTRMEEGDYTFLEEFSFHVFARKEKQGWTSYYKPTGHRRSIDYSTFPFELPYYDRRYFSNDLFGWNLINHLDSTDFASRELIWGDVVKESMGEFKVVRESLQPGYYIDYYLDIETGALRKARTTKLKVIGEQRNTYTVGARYSPTRFNSHKYELSRTFFMSHGTQAPVIDSVHEVTRSHYIDRLSNVIMNSYSDTLRVVFYEQTHTMSKPFNASADILLPAERAYKASFWDTFEGETGHAIQKRVRESLDKRAGLDSQFNLTKGRIIIDHKDYGRLSQRDYEDEGHPMSGKWLFRKKDFRKRSKVGDVNAFIRTLAEDKYTPDFAPDLSWQNIPLLLDLIDSEEILENFPRNVMTADYMHQCRLGVIAMWLIDSTRLSHSGKKGWAGGWYISPRPMFRSSADKAKDAQGRGYHVSHTNDEKFNLAANAFKLWWKEVKDMPPGKASKKDPLAGIDLFWAWTDKH